MIVNQGNVHKVQAVDEEDLDQDSVEMLKKIVIEEETVVTADHVAKTVNNASIIVIVANAKTDKEIINKKIIKRKVKKTDHDQNKEMTEKKEMIVKFIEKHLKVIRFFMIERFCVLIYQCVFFDEFYWILFFLNRVQENSSFFE